MNGSGAHEQPAAALRSSIAWALLGLVIERPSYGWELVHRFSRTYGEMVALSSARQIYTALDALMKRSLIEEVAHEPQQEPARRPKPHYRATERGVQAYEEWLLIQLEEERQRQRLFAIQLAVLEPQTALEVIDRYEEECLTDAEETPQAQTEKEGMANRLAEQDEQLALQARLLWVRYAREEFTTLVEQRAREEAEK